MSYRLMKGTALGSMEKMMLTIPNFDYNKGDDMNEQTTLLSLLNIVLKKGATFNPQANYKEFIKSCFHSIDKKRFQKRLQQLIDEYDNTFFVSETHFFRFLNLQNSGAIFENNSKQQAILYLLSSDDFLYNCFKENKYRNISSMKLPKLSTESYAIYKVAKMIESEKENIKIDELSDYNLISDTTFKLIINSFILLNIKAI